MDVKEERSLIHMIKKECGELANVLEENNITTNDDIQSLCYEALAKLYPGGGRKIIERSKAWKFIHGSLQNNRSSLHTKSPVSSSPVSIDLSSDEVLSTTSCSPARTSSPAFSLPVISSSPIGHGSIHKPQPTKAPQYVLYSDPAIQDAASNGELNKSMRERLIRCTINNMVSTSSSLPSSRFPKSTELEEMAKSLIVAYPCLRDAETDHGVVLKALKRRLSNIKPVVKPQGSTPSKRRYVSDDNKSKKSVEEDSPSSTFVNESDDPVDGKVVMARHYEGLLKEMDKKKPNATVVNTYLNKEFVVRRDWLKEVSPSERVERLMKTYPCFKNHEEIIEEARRVLLVEFCGDRDGFRKKCLTKLTEEIESVVYYGIHSKGLNAPKSPKLGSKIVYLLQNLHLIFGLKKQNKKQVDLVYQLKAHEDPENLCAKRVGNVPALVLYTDTCYLITGKVIVSKIDRSTFYLLDLDYPRNLEIGLSILQYFIFGDQNVPEDISQSFQSALSSYQEFKNDGE